MTKNISSRRIFSAEKSGAMRAIRMSHDFTSHGTVSAISLALVFPIGEYGQRLPFSFDILKSAAEIPARNLKLKSWTRRLKSRCFPKRSSGTQHPFQKLINESDWSEIDKIVDNSFKTMDALGIDKVVHLAGQMRLKSREALKNALAKVRDPSTRKYVLELLTCTNKFTVVRPYVWRKEKTVQHLRYLAAWKCNCERLFAAISAHPENHVKGDKLRDIKRTFTFLGRKLGVGFLGRF
eukprot:Gregarina_sp_Poly_1__1095@NODE_1268_length_4539_cov_74_613819_g863_i0_p2_GENE_NODE_1268_length_4539_cov_74_613819_g863_i0NODE_1268_length_4539_cov_74_613819_g863_i0_p2_ORF_typecomplete_len237_score15_18_NODE_1268_length_4539_cov_74_613819_g863_i0125835